MWDLTTATATYNYNLGFSPYGLGFNSSGNIMYVSLASYIKQYDLSTPWDLSTATYNWKQVNSGTTFVCDLYLFDSDKYIYTLTEISGIRYIIKFKFGTVGDITTITEDSKVSVDGIDIGANGFHIESDLSKVYITGSVSDKITKIEFNTNGDLSTLDFTNKQQVATGYAYSGGLYIGNSGQNLYIGRTIVSDRLYQRNMTTSHDLSTLGGTYTTLLVGQQIYGIMFKPDGTKMYLADYDAS
jgi:DNA-binding beta-propeller fold protein YncE